MNKDEELERLQQENQALQAANQTLRECVRESIQGIERLQKQVKDLEGVIASQQERIKTLEGQVAKDSHNSSLPPSSDRFVRPPKSLRQKSGRKPGGQTGHRSACEAALGHAIPGGRKAVSSVFPSDTSTFPCHCFGPSTIWQRHADAGDVSR